MIVETNLRVLRSPYSTARTGIRMTPDDSDPIQILLGHIEYLETMSNCLGLLAGTLRNEGKHQAADDIAQVTREQRIQAMLVRGQLAAEIGSDALRPAR